MNYLLPQEALRPMAWLEGTWRVEGLDIGRYQVHDANAQIASSSFHYCEEMTFAFNGQPMFNYSSRSWIVETNRPMHQNAGFLMITPGTNKVSFILARNSGMASIEEGVVTDNIVDLNSTGILTCAKTNQPAIIKEVLSEWQLFGAYTLYGHNGIPRPAQAYMYNVCESLGNLIKKRKDSIKVAKF